MKWEKCKHKAKGTSTFEKKIQDWLKKQTRKWKKCKGAIQMVGEQIFVIIKRVSLSNAAK